MTAWFAGLTSMRPARLRRGPRPESEGSVLFADKDGSLVAPSRPTGITSLPNGRSLPAWRQVGASGRIWLVLSRSGRNWDKPRVQSANKRGATVDTLRPAVTLNNAFALLPGGQLLVPVGNTNGACEFLRAGLTVNWLERPLPYSHQYLIRIQREFQEDPDRSWLRRKSNSQAADILRQ